MPSDPSTFLNRQPDSGPDELEVSASSGSAYKALLSNRNYRYWFASSFISALGDWIGFAALTALIPAMEAGSGNGQAGLFAIGTLLLMRLLPNVIFGPLGGVIADRYDRKKLIVVTDIARFVLFAAVAVADDIVALFALTFIVEIFSLIFLSAKDASMPSVVENKEHLSEANQLNLLVSYGTLPLGAASTFIIAVVASSLGDLVPEGTDPLRIALMVDALSYLVSAGLMARVHLPGERARREESQENDTSVLQELKDGLTFIRDFPLLRALISGMVGVFFGAGLIVSLGSSFVQATLGRPDSDWTLLFTLVGVGLVIGIVVLVPVMKRFDQEKSFTVFLTAVGAISAVTALAPNFYVVLPLGLMLGAAAGVGVVQGYTLLHSNTVDETRARTFAVFYTLTRVGLLVSFVLGPFAAGALQSINLPGIRVMLMFGGVVAAYFGIRARIAIGDMKRGQAEGLTMTAAAAKARLQGLFITFEGVEGAGKSTQIKLLAQQLQAEGHEVLVTREPGGAPLAERIRQIVLDPAITDMTDRTEALLMAAARADHVHHTIKPALEQGTIVLCDRFVDSSLAYQGHARGLDVEDVRQVNHWAIDGVEADVVVLLKLDPKEGMRRVEERAAEGRANQLKNLGGKVYELSRFAEQVAKDRMEVEGIEFHQRVAKGFLDLARRDRRRYVVVDAGGHSDDIQRQVRAGLNRWLPLADEANPSSSDQVDTTDPGVDDISTAG
ncbi:MAG: dTMP kinase [Euzebya sp.]